MFVIILLCYRNLALIKSYNCIYYSHYLFDIPPKCTKTSEPEDEQLCITVHTLNDNICDINPLDNSSSIGQINPHCLT